MPKISKLFLFIVFSILSVQASEQGKVKEKATPVYLNYCSNYGNGVSYSYQSCVNNNFFLISTSIGGFYQHCTNFGVEVDYFFLSCVNGAFREAQYRLKNTVYLPDCQNYNRQTLEYFFVSCVNNNFSEIQRAIRRQEDPI